MAYRRPHALQQPADPESLTRDMVGIGMAFAAPANPAAPIEETLLRASVCGMEEDDLRVLAVLTRWLGVHQRHVNVDRLNRCLSAAGSERVRAYWAAVGHWLGKDRRYVRLGKQYAGQPVPLLRVGSAFQLARRGEDLRFKDTVLRVPKGVLRDRASDVVSPHVLAQHHAGYRQRVRMGPTWRADVWTALEAAPDASVAETARQVGCAFATAWQVVQDFRLLREADGSG